MWWTKKKPKIDNIYTAINNELKRCHEQFDEQINRQRNANNADIFLKIIREYKDGLLAALEKQPSHHEAIEDLQNTVTEMLLTETEPKK